MPSDITRTSSPDLNHVIVIRRNQFFVLETEVNGARLSTADLKTSFDAIYSMAGVPEVPVGALTSENRDVWTAERQKLLNVSPLNKESLDVIETAAFVVCLDDTKPVTKEERRFCSCAYILNRFCGLLAWRWKK